LGNRVAIFENRLELQADTLNRALNNAERMEEELRSRIRELEEELKPPRALDPILLALSSGVDLTEGGLYAVGSNAEAS